MKRARIVALLLAAAMIFQSTSVNVFASDEGLIVEQVADDFGNLGSDSEVFQELPTDENFIVQEADDLYPDDQYIDDTYSLEIDEEPELEPVDDTEELNETQTETAISETESLYSDDLYTDDPYSLEVDGDFEIESVDDTVELSGSQIKASGSCGANAEYLIEYNDDSLTDAVLTISGSGKMSDYSITDTSATSYWPFTSAPWSDSDIFQLTTVRVLNDVSNVGKYAFCGAGGVTNVDLSSSVETIGDGAFWGCSSLQELTLPEGMTEIGASAFYYCKNLKSITIPRTVARIDKSAFYLCSALTDVYYGGTEEEWELLVSSGIVADRNESLLNAAIHFVSPVQISMWEECDDSGLVQNRMTSLVYSCGSFLWNKAGEAGLGLSGKTDYDHFYMQVGYDPEISYENVSMKLSLPDGFSFRPDCLETDCELSFTNDTEKILAVYPIYSENFTDSRLCIKAAMYSGTELITEETISTISVIKNVNQGKIYLNDSSVYETALSPRWFSLDSYAYNHSLATMSGALSMMAYRSSELIEASYWNLGFGDVEIYEYEGVADSSTTVNFSIAKKKMIVNGQIVTLIAVPMRGSADFGDWVGNLYVDPAVSVHNGFEVAKDDVKAKLDSYLSERGLLSVGTTAAKLLFTGHSRAAAVANLLAADYDSIAEGVKVSPGNIYAYTFATPNATKDSNISKDLYSNIYNFVFWSDPVPSVAPRFLNYNKYGWTYQLPSPLSGYYYDFIASVSSKYEAYTGDAYEPITLEYLAELFFDFDKELIDYLYDGDVIAVLERTGKKAFARALRSVVWINALMTTKDTIESIEEFFKRISCTHSMEGYLSWMESISSLADCTRNRANFKLVQVSCPVDVEVYDSAGNLAGKVENLLVDTSISSTVSMFVDGETKYAVLPGNDSYQIKMYGTDTGTMEYTVYEYGEGEEISRCVLAENIELYDGRVLTANVNNIPGNEIANYSIVSEDGEEIVLHEDTETEGGEKETESEAETDEPPSGDILATGGCGENVTWALDSEGTMTFSGSGDMEDFYWGFDSFGYEATNIPWTQWKDGGYSPDYHGTTDYRSRIKKAVFKPGITGIGNYTLVGCSHITQVDIADTVTRIGDEAFRGLSSCKKITVPEGLKELGKGAYSGCGIQGSITLPKGITEIPENAFSGCSGLREISLHDGVTFIGNSAFNASGLETFTIPDSVTSIGENILGNCTSLTALVIGSGITEIPKDAFRNLNNLLEIKINEGIVSIDGYAFSSDSSLTEITLPDSLVTIGDSAFGYCTRLSTLTFGKGLKTIGDGAFRSTGLYEVSIPDGVESIGWYAFQECDRLTDVVIPDSVTSLGAHTFSACKSLENVVLGNGVEVIGEYTFSDDSSLKNITLGKNIKRIEGYVFYGCGSLGQIILPSSVEYIGIGSFNGCAGLKEIVIPDSVTIIENSSFLRCSNLEKVTFGDKLEEIGPSAFFECAIKELVIPDTVTKIGGSAFIYNGNLTTVSLGNGLQYIDSCAFAHCGNLEEITFPDGLKSFGTNVFDRCSSLKQVTIPDSIQIISEALFAKCSSLESVTLGKNVNKLENNAFGDCHALKNIEIPSSVTILGNRTFNNCNAMKYITFTGNAPYIGDNCFSGDHLIAYYPEGDETWKSDVMQDYGGTVTWHTICEPHVPAGAVDENVIAAQCESDGSKDSVVYCSNCGLELGRKQEVLKAVGHSWTLNNTEAAKCDEDGHYQYKCDNCDAYKEDGIPAIGHDWKIVETVEGTCSTAGYTKKQCNNCGEYDYLDTGLNPDKHEADSHGYRENKKEASCTQEGYTGDLYCGECGKLLQKGQSISAGHNWSSWKIIKKATTKKTGKKTRTCSICRGKQTKTISRAKVTLTKTKVTLKKKKKITLKIKKKTEGDSIKSWRSSNKKIATVTKKGVVKGIKKGNVIITLTMKSGAKAKCKIKVK